MLLVGGGGGRTQILTDKANFLPANSPPSSPPSSPPPPLPLLIYTDTLRHKFGTASAAEQLSFRYPVNLLIRLWKTIDIKFPQVQYSLNISRLTYKMLLQKTQTNLKKDILYWEPFPPGTVPRGFCTPRYCISCNCYHPSDYENRRLLYAFKPQFFCKNIKHDCRYCR